MDTTTDDYLKKRRRYYNLLDKKHKLAPVHLLDGSFAGTQQYCQLDEAAEKKLNLNKFRQQYSNAENDLLRAKYDDGEYDLENEFVREVLINDIIEQHGSMIH